MMNQYDYLSNERELEPVFSKLFERQTLTVADAKKLLNTFNPNEKIEFFKRRLEDKVENDTLG